MLQHGGNFLASICGKKKAKPLSQPRFKMIQLGIGFKGKINA